MECSILYKYNPTNTLFMLRLEERLYTPFCAIDRKHFIEWLFTQQRCLKLKISTIFLAVRILDKYTSNQTKRPSKLRLLVSTILVIACKYEEVFSSQISFKDLQREHNVPIKYFACLERDILEKLDYNLGFSIAPFHLWNLCTITNTESMIKRFSLFLLCSSLLDPISSQYLPSELACASLAVARGQNHRWSYEDHQVTGYNSFDFTDATILVQRWEPSMTYLYRRFIRDQLKFN